MPKRPVPSVAALRCFSPLGSLNIPQFASFPLTRNPESYYKTHQAR